MTDLKTELAAHFLTTALFKYKLGRPIQVYVDALATGNGRLKAQAYSDLQAAIYLLESDVRETFALPGQPATANASEPDPAHSAANVCLHDQVARLKRELAQAQDHCHLLEEAHKEREDRYATLVGERLDDERNTAIGQDLDALLYELPEHASVSLRVKPGTPFIICRIESQPVFHAFAPPLVETIDTGLHEAVQSARFQYDLHTGAPQPVYDAECATDCGTNPHAQPPTDR